MAGFSMELGSELWPSGLALGAISSDHLFLYFSALLGTESRILPTLGKCSTIKFYALLSGRKKTNWAKLKEYCFLTINEI